MRVQVFTALLLVASTFAAYAGVRDHDFVNYDDPIYILENPLLSGGLSAASLLAAFEPYELNWIPLTWISLQLQYAIHGAEPAPFLLANVALHALASVLLLGVLHRATGAFGASAFVAFVFALHPLHVESVAWASERKDVLSAVFFVLALRAHVRHAHAEREGAASWRGPLAVFTWLTLGLMAKPMLVTLPFVLLLIDLWPLRRLGSERRAVEPARLLRALLEKAPLFALAAVISVVTLEVQRAGGATSYGEVALSAGARVANALHTVVVFAQQTFWPTGLAVFHPHPIDAPSGARIAAEAAGLVGITTLALAGARRLPWITVGWLWYVGMLVPVIGLVQVGAQARADRYAYLPQIGLVIAAVWTLAWAASRVGERIAAHSDPSAARDTSRVPARLLAAVGVLAVLALALAAREQVRHWRSSEALFARALAVTDGNFIAHHLLGAELAKQKRTEEAQAHYEAAVALDPPWTPPYMALADLHLGQGRPDPAARLYTRALSLDPRLARAATGAGMARLRLGARWEAREHFERAIALGASDGEPETGLALLASLESDEVRAIELYRRALAKSPGYVTASNNLAWLLATHPDEELRDPSEAIRVVEEPAHSSRSPQLLDTLAAAYASAGRFEDAVHTADRAIARAREEGAPPAHPIELRRELYVVGRPYLEPR